MDKLRRLSKPVSHALIFGLLALSIHLPAHAALVGTDAVVQAAQAQHDRARLQTLLNRDDVQQRLVGQGIDPAQVKARVDALSDNEVQTLAAKFDQLPAGGDALGVLVFLFVVLLITDILGLTDVFPFVKKPARR